MSQKFQKISSQIRNICHLSRCCINRRNFHITGDIIKHSQTPGLEHLRNNRLNKGLAFSLEERFALGIHGLQPSCFKTLDQQVELCKIRLSRYSNNLNKYVYLMDLHERNEKLFFRLLIDNLQELLPIVYTPTVAQACTEFGIFYRRMKCLFISINDKGRIYDVVKNWPEPDVRASVVTDGGRILGLGDMGVYGVCIAVGKMGLYTALAGVKPHVCMPVVLDVGTNNPHLLNDPLYVGLKQERVVGQVYDDFIQEFFTAVTKRFGHRMLVQFEDFGNNNAFRLLERYRDKYCVFNDDIQGTAGVTVAGLLTSKRMIDKKLIDHTYLYLGAGQAAVGIADLSVRIMMEQEKATLVDARRKIWMFDVHGLLTTNRTEGLDEYQAVYAKDHAPMKNFLDVVHEVKPSVIIGVSTVGNTFTPEILKAVASYHERPIVFALSNPNSKAECTPKDAYEHTEGRAIYASGSPFGDVNYNGKLYKPGQGNNAYIYPGIALGAIMSGIHHIGEDVVALTAQCVCDLVSDEDLKHGSLYPPLTRIRDISLNIASKIFQYAYDKGISTVYPEPCDKKAYIQSQLYNFDYEPSLPRHWQYPKLETDRVIKNK